MSEVRKEIYCNKSSNHSLIGLPASGMVAWWLFCPSGASLDFTLPWWFLQCQTLL